MSVPSNFEMRYVFTLSANVVATPVGETPTGYRVDIQYEAPGKVFTDRIKYFDAWVAPRGKEIGALLGEPAFKIDETKEEVEKENNEAAEEEKEQKNKKDEHKEKKEIVRKIFKLRKQFSLRQPTDEPKLQKELGWYGFRGELVSGSDWAIIRSDGVAEFTGLVTLRSKDEDHALLALTLEGPVDLLSDVRTDVTASPSQGFQSVLTAAGDGSLKQAPLVIAATFEAAGKAEPWAPKRMRRQAEGFWKYRALTRAQCAMLGDVFFTTRPDNPIAQLKADFYRLRAK